MKFLHSTFYILHSRRKGFTLIEMVVVLGIMVILSIGAFLALSSRRNRTSLDVTTSQMVTLLREAQSRATAGESSVSWGVRFGNLTSTTPFYSLFNGSYSTSSRLNYYPLPPLVSYSTSSIAQGAVLDIAFAQLTGLPSATASINVALAGGAGKAVASSTITVSATGLISF